ncbi:DJ-1/PfpI family protein [Micromonospora sp. NPDC050695]|uniref:DJ-1/PfpI family protein n=1 Tax=Micromonospora sp. NPDC050695 TaxID=3154938 RepID=UPI003406D7B7
MAPTLQGKRIAFLAADGVEEVEYVQPREAVEDAGATVELVSLKPGSIQSFNHLDKSRTYDVDVTADKADAGGYDALVLPGGMATTSPPSAPRSRNPSQPPNPTPVIKRFAS